MLSLKTTLAAASIAVAALAAPLSPARADAVGVWVGPGIGFGIGGVGVGVGIGHGYHGPVYHHAYAGHCSQDDALDRAAAMGVKKRYVSGVSQTRISVRGMHQGQPVKVTMNRHSDACAIRSFNYL